MDPNQTPAQPSPAPAAPITPGQMDPKLQATYDKVMNFSVPSPTDPTATTPATPPTQNPTMPVTPLSPTSPTMAPTTPVSPVTPTAMPSMTPEPTPAVPTAAPVSPATMMLNNATPTTTPTTTHAVSAKKKNSMMPVLLGVGGVIFVIAYAVIWIKIFNIKVPFLPF